LAQVLPAADPAPAAEASEPQRRGSAAATAVLICYLLAAVAVTWRLWADPASRTVAGNPNDADFFAWCLRYTATAVSHGRLPSLVTAAMNAPQGISVMWNTSLLLPGIVLTPVTLLAGPQAALTVLLTAGFAGSAASMFAVLRRWEVSTGAAALAGAVYGFSPALLQASTGHFNLQFAVLPPLIIHMGLRLCWPRETAPGSPAQRIRAPLPVREGAVLGLLITAQLFTGEELLMLTALAGVLLAVVLALSRPRAALARWIPVAGGLAVAAGVTLLLSGYALWAQFRGPLAQHGSAFTPDFFKNDVSGFVTPSSYLLFHTSASAAAAVRYQGGAPEYLAYLGWPLIAALALAAVAFWRHPAVRATAVTAAVLELLSLGTHPLVSGTLYAGVTMPWQWVTKLPLVGTVLPDRLSIVADGAAAALLAFALDGARARVGPARPWVTAVAVLACLPLVPLPLRTANAPGVPAGWSAAFADLRLPPSARVLVVPVPTPTQTDAMRWQADTGEPRSLNGGYFVGPAWNGQAYVGGDGVSATAKYLDGLWSGGSAGPAPSMTQVRADLAAWRPSAVVAVTSQRSVLAHYLETVLGPPAVRSGRILAWRL
jgi:hypothetical protein